MLTPPPSKSTTTVRTTGPGLATLLTVLFVGLKLTGFINWPWIWVLSPLWISFLLVIVIIVVAVLAAMYFDKR